MTSEIAKVAAKWWADCLRDGARLDNGDDSATGFISSALGSMIQQRQMAETSNESIDLFEQCLAVIIDGEHPRIVDVDYHPDNNLCEAAEKAGLKLGMTSLPWKTTMWIDYSAQIIKVSCGYGAPTEVIYGQGVAT